MKEKYATYTLFGIFISLAALFYIQMRYVQGYKVGKERAMYENETKKVTKPLQE